MPCQSPCTPARCQLSPFVTSVELCDPALLDAGFPAAGLTVTADTKGVVPINVGTDPEEQWALGTFVVRPQLEELAAAGPAVVAAASERPWALCAACSSARALRFASLFCPFAEPVIVVWRRALCRAPGSGLSVLAHRKRVKEAAASGRAAQISRGAARA